MTYNLFFLVSNDMNPLNCLLPLVREGLCKNNERTDLRLLTQTSVQFERRSRFSDTYFTT